MNATASQTTADLPPRNLNLLGHQQIAHRDPEQYAQLLGLALAELDQCSDPSLRARQTHAALTSVIADLLWWPLSGLPTELHELIDDLQRRHLELARCLPVDELAGWLSQNFSADDDRLQLPIGPYLPILGTVGREALEQHVANIERFGGTSNPMSTLRLLQREIALHHADADEIVRAFGGSLQTADQFLGVARAFILVRMPLQAEAWARRGGRLSGPSAFACRMIALEFRIERDPTATAALQEAREALLRNPSREVAALIRRATGSKWADVCERLRAVAETLPPKQRRDCLSGFGITAHDE